MINKTLIFYSLLCSFCSSIVLGIVTFMLLVDTSILNFFMPQFMIFAISAIIVYTIIYFTIYIIVATPIQISLNLKPKQFNLLYLVIYILVAGLTSIIVTILLEPSFPTLGVNFYIVSFGSATVLWVFDSIFLQKSHLSKK